MKVVLSLGDHRLLRSMTQFRSLLDDIPIFGPVTVCRSVLSTGYMDTVSAGSAKLVSDDRSL